MGLSLKEAENPIYLVELLAVYVALSLGWSDVWQARGDVHRQRGFSNDLGQSLLLHPSWKRCDPALRKEEDQHQWKVWFGRVCSHFNIADGPSLGHVEDMKARGAVHNQ